MTIEVKETQDECSKCLYKGEVSLPNKEELVVVCRKYPPILMNLGTGIITIYPAISNEAWCGEFHAGVGPAIKSVKELSTPEIPYGENIVKMFPTK